jgi:hypothetical protein
LPAIVLARDSNLCWSELESLFLPYPNYVSLHSIFIDPISVSQELGISPYFSPHIAKLFPKKS